MAITKFTPRTIHLGGPVTEVNDLHASGAITPGHFLDRSAGKYIKHASAGVAGSTIALDQSEMNKGLDDAYADGDLVKAGVGVPGTTFLAFVPSGQNLADGAGLEHDGAGRLIAHSTGTIVAKAIEAKDNSAGPGDARMRVEVV